jgi:co-chaperonin GroES (HSP10)
MAHVLRPARGYVLLEPMPTTLVENGIYLPLTPDGELKQQYVVKAVGKGRIIRTKKKRRWLMVFPEVRVGDRVVANRYAGHPVDINGHFHRIVRFDSIMAVVGLEDSDSRLAPAPNGVQFGSS